MGLESSTPSCVCCTPGFLLVLPITPCFSLDRFRSEGFFSPALPPPELLSVALQLPTHPLTPSCRWRKALLSKKTLMSFAGP